MSHLIISEKKYIFIKNTSNSFLLITSEYTVRFASIPLQVVTETTGGEFVDFFHRRFFFHISITMDIAHVYVLFESKKRDEYCEKKHTVVELHECVVEAIATAHAHV